MIRSKQIGSLVVSVLALVPIAAEAQVYVSVTPPAAIIEARPASPGLGHQWVAGSWKWDGSRYTWNAGRWERRPEPTARYVGPQWRRSRQGWRVVEGRWVGRRGVTITTAQAPVQPVVMPPIQPPAETVAVRIAPPAPVPEAQPTSPDAGYTWIPGFWSWDGRRYLWAAGRWEQPPNATAGATYTPPEWRRDGVVFRFHAGQWTTPAPAPAPAPQPQPVAVAPVGVAGTAVIAPNAPPAPLTEVQSPAPGPGFAWVAGYWTWSNAQFFWTGGHWERQPTNAEAYEPSAWERDGTRYRFRQGRWRDRQGTTVAQAAWQPPPPVEQRLPRGRAAPAIVVATAPPAPVTEFRPPSPGNGYAWVGGNWAWSGSQYQWTPGRWEVPPAGAQTYVTASWSFDGTGHRFLPGRWQNASGVEVR